MARGMGTGVGVGFGLGRASCACEFLLPLGGQREKHDHDQIDQHDQAHLMADPPLSQPPHLYLHPLISVCAPTTSPLGVPTCLTLPDTPQPQSQPKPHPHCNRSGGRRHPPLRTWDSSPQFCRDYEICIVRVAPRCLLPSLLRASYELHHLWNRGEMPERFPQKKAREKVLMDFIGGAFHTHQLPPTLIGFGSAGLGRKMQALLHGVRLEVFDGNDLLHWIKELVTIQQDHGTEHGIMRSKPIQVSSILPYFCDASSAEVKDMMECVAAECLHEPIVDDIYAIARHVSLGWVAICSCPGGWRSAWRMVWMDGWPAGGGLIARNTTEFVVDDCL